MNWEFLSRIAFPLSTLAFFLLALVSPTLLGRRRNGEWPIVFHKKANPFQATMEAFFGLYLTGVAVYAALYGFLGPNTIGVFTVPKSVHLIGWGLSLAGLVGTILAQQQMGKSWRIGIDDEKTELVTHGLFAIVRNPIFSCMFLWVAGMVLVAPSGWSVMGWLGMTSLVSMQVRLEEEHLRSIHGKTYEAYASRVGRFAPLVGRNTV